MGRKIILIIILLIYLIYNIYTYEFYNFRAIDHIKTHIDEYLDIVKDGKLHIKVYYNSFDYNSMSFTKPELYTPCITHSPSFCYKFDTNINKEKNKKKYIYNFLDNLNKTNKDIFNINYYDTYDKTLETTFFESIYGEEYKEIREKIKIIDKHLTIPNMLDKVPKILLFFKKNENNYCNNNKESNHIIEYNGNYNLDLNGELKDTQENINNFIEDTIRKNLLVEKSLDKNHHFGKYLEINNKAFYKCIKCANFIEGVILNCKKTETIKYDRANKVLGCAT